VSSAGEYKLNLECNHATLSGHSCHHELEMARIYGMLGSVDANTGDAQTGWDTDQFLTDVSEATLIMLSVIKNGGLAPGGFNFDAKLRRESVDVEDLFIAHILGMDTLARGLRNAAKLLQVINHNISVKPISFSQPCDTSEKYNAFLTWLQ
jgi:xylose isomerase